MKKRPRRNHARAWKEQLLAGAGGVFDGGPVEPPIDAKTPQVSAATVGIGRYFTLYNSRRPHSSLADRTPDDAYFAPMALQAAACPPARDPRKKPCWAAEPLQR